MKIILLRIIWFLLLTISISASARSQEILDIDPVYQKTPVWCWAAVSEMVFKYYDVPNLNPGGNFQCGIVALLHPVCNINCLNCIVPAGNMDTMNQMLIEYPRRTSTLIISTAMSGTLSFAQVRTEINAGRPIVAGISPSGYKSFSNVSEHVALIVGYDGRDLIVNDPFPYTTQFFLGDPYLRNGGEREKRGQYRINYEDFVSNLHWNESIYRIKVSKNQQQSMVRSCCTDVMRCGPFINQPPLEIGTPCWCGTTMGPVSGRACP